VRYGRKWQTNVELKRYWYVVVGAGLVLAVVGHYLFTIFNNDPLGFEDSYLINLVMSILFISMYLAVRDRSRPARWIAWMKMLGTGLTSVGILIILPVLDASDAFEGNVLQDPGFMYYLMFACVVFDLLYIYLLHAREAEAAVPVPVPVPAPG